MYFSLYKIEFACKLSFTEFFGRYMYVNKAMCTCKSSSLLSDSACTNLQIKYDIEGVAKISVLSRASLFPEFNGNMLAGGELES